MIEYLLAGLVLLSVLSGCGMKAEEENAEQSGMTETVLAKEQDMGERSERSTYTVWNVYWNLDGVEAQIEEMAEEIQNVSYFAAYFDQNDHVFLPENTISFYEETKEAYRERGWNCYLTIVNDQVLADASSDLKSTELLYRILGVEEAYQAHAEEILALAGQYGYDGLEIDYENIRKDETLWGYFMPFVEYLYQRCQEENLKLRIVIETNIEPEKIDWVEGPTYVVMCYNLYGGHSGPGPKADRNFLEEIMDKMEHVPGRTDYALANGGFDWSEEGTVSGITTAKAEQLLLESGASVKRDEESRANYFTYQDENGAGHEVWYADEETMQAWISWLEAEGNHQFSIWRLGR